MSEKPESTLISAYADATLDELPNTNRYQPKFNPGGPAGATA